MNRTDLATIRAVFEAFVDPLFLLDGNTQVLRANTAARERLGADVEGRPVGQLLTTPQLLNAVDAALRGETPKAVELVLSDNIDHTYNVNVQPLYFSDRPGTPRALVTMHDITTLRRSEQLGVEFLANASHELRTPLASLLGFIETLQGPAKEDTEARERFLQIMHAQASRMTRLVQDLLSLARIEFNEHVSPTSTIDLLATARQAVEQLQHRAATRGITLTAKLPRSLPPVVGDTDQIMQVVVNLIENAIKYTHESTPIEVSIARDGKLARLSVQDHGPGISREHLPRLTERFYRIDAGRSRHMGGTGLGLSIVKHIINRHRGQFHVESELGEGSRFEVTLPLLLE